MASGAAVATVAPQSSVRAIAIDTKPHVALGDVHTINPLGLILLGRARIEAQHLFNYFLQIIR